MVIWDDKHERGYEVTLNIKHHEMCGREAHRTSDSILSLPRDCWSDRQVLICRRTRKGSTRRPRNWAPLCETALTPVTQNRDWYLEPSLALFLASSNFNYPNATHPTPTTASSWIILQPIASQMAAPIPASDKPTLIHLAVRFPPFP